MSGLQFIVALITALVAPVALYAQQRLQIRRDDRRWEVENEQRQHDADRAEIAARLAEQRGVYQTLLQAAYAFRAERSVWAARASIGIESGSTGEGERLGLRIGTPSLSQSLPTLQEAIGVARLYTPSEALLQRLLDLLSAADRVERTLTTKNATAGRARDDWGTFESCLGALANECAAAIALAEGRERPSFEQATTGRESQD